MAKKVLMVDDDPQLRDLISLTFKGEGMEIETVASGAECLKILEKGFNGVLLVDVMMPEMNGWQLVREIKRKNLLKGILICMFTAKGEPDKGMDEIKECVMDYFRKPIDTRVLVASVRSYLTLVEDQ